MNIQDRKFEAWRHGLLDVSRRNKLMNYRKTRRTTLQITEPGMNELFERLVGEGQKLAFRKRMTNRQGAYVDRMIYLFEQLGAPIEIAEGELRSELETDDMNLTLAKLRARARLYQEEQGINILYLSFGFLKWRQKPSDDWLLSPLVLVPVVLEMKSITSPFTIRRLEEDVVLNPTLDYVLESDYHIVLPDPDPAAESLEAYLQKVENMVSPMGWAVVREANLGLLSFLKIVMYKDLEKNREKIFANPVIRAFCGDYAGLPEIREEWMDYAHDRSPAADLCQVVGADASQKDAILLSRNGVSFVLQGPPGTGKSQTITNIIAQALADGKKVLFVSQKMAALSVVYRRLMEAGIADYCLSLHDYKAEKKAVLQDLLHTLDAPKKTLKTGVTDVYAALEKDRSQLNFYVNEMNREREPLGKSLFEVVTELTELEGAESLAVSEAMDALSGEEFAACQQLLETYAGFLRRYDGEIMDNPWEGTALTEQDPWTGQVLFGQVPVEKFCRDIKAVRDSSEELNQAMGSEKAWSYEDFFALCANLQLDICSRRAGEIGLERYGEALFSGEGAARAADLAARLERCADAAGTYAEDVNWMELGREGLLREKSRVEELAGELKDCGIFMREAGQTLGLTLPVSSRGLRQLEAALAVLQTPVDFKMDWYLSGLSPEELKARIRRLKDLSDIVLAQKERIDRDWEPRFYTLDEAELLERFRTEYGSFFKRLGGEYKADRKLLSTCRKGAGKLRDEDCIRGLEDLREYHADIIDFHIALQKLPKELGLGERDIFSDWAGLLADLDRCEAAERYAGTYLVGETLSNLCELPHGQRQSMTFGGSTARELYASGRISRIRASLEELGETDFSEACQAAGGQIDTIDQLLAWMEEAKALFSESREPSACDTPLACLDGLSSLTGHFESVQAAREDAGSGYAEYGIKPEDPITRQALDRIVYPYIAKSCGQKLQQLPGDLSAMYPKEPLAGAIPFLETFAAWFPKRKVTSMSLKDLQADADRCQDTESLSSWLHYADLESACREHGLDAFLTVIREKKMDPEESQTLYRKSVLTKWLTDTIAANGLYELMRFGADAHEEKIRRFGKESESAEQVSRARLAQELSAQKPSGIRQLAGAMDEVSILRREAGKKSRIMPLRKLFRTIPGLMLRLKPCFMMSPLSAAYFLDSDMYEFDMVIFDEASQILPEDAVGAIYRGRQAIIAGDTRQLPPTSFFTANAKNVDDYDREEESDEDYIPDVISESLLDEAGINLPQCTLLWHYRSKEESLIAFSNRQLYEGRLITFPGSAVRKDRGLKYVLVEDGVYEGGGKNCNLREAEVCVQLLEDHIQKHPDRSLGIIAFSEKQQAVIENAVNRFRLSHLEYESFFDEAAQEPFFVKNLENVQGDERDTIFFSICYAKNSQGRMYQRFGPLGTAGGERRLNVAITRAKYNIKLIGSIEPADILVKEDTSQGVRLLRDYMQYAIENTEGVARGTEAAWTGEDFADDVAAYIAGLGYRIRRDIGESACKIDIGIVDPDRETDYLAGIECDGTHYRFARTAHDRDVLRRSVLSAMGWKLHHVWAMSWFMKPEEEKARLRAFLENAMRKDVIGETENTEPVEDTDPDGIPEEEGLQEESEAGAAWHDLMEETDDSRETLTLRFATYRQADTDRVMQSAETSPEEKLRALLALIVEEEQPIHKKELYRRVGQAYRMQKVTPAVKNAVDQCLSRELQGQISERDGFLFLTGEETFVPRRPVDGEDPREIDLIAPEEIEAGLCRILEFSIGLGQDDLIRECARQFGFSQTGPRMRQQFARVLESLLQKESVRISEGRVYLDKHAFTEEEA